MPFGNHSGTFRAFLMPFLWCWWDLLCADVLLLFAISERLAKAVTAVEMAVFRAAVYDIRNVNCLH